jgi:osmotically inducible protein OsmC
MAVTERSARTIWQGDLETGEGKVSSGIGTFSDVPMSLPSRIGEPNGYSSPEDMLAGAHSGCLAMNLSGTLAKNGTPPERLDVNAVVGVGPKEGGGLEVKHSHVTISGKVPGITEDEFRKLAEQAERTCPISNAIRGNVEITTEITFEG